MLSLPETTLLDQPDISDWLKLAIIESQQRDVLDALNDAQLLVQVLERRWIDAGHTAKPSINNKKVVTVPR